MCGRFTLATAADILAELFELQGQPLPPLEPRFNIAPTQSVAVVRPSNGTREMALVRWGLIPSWAKDSTIGARLINARAESVVSKPAFRSAFRSRRCLLPADGFYEWAAEAGGKQPYLYRRPDGQAFAFAGLWERWRSPDGQAVESCTIITTDANALVRPVHGRMPVILPRTAYALWLDPGTTDTAALVRLLVSNQDDQLVVRRVSKRVNSAAVDDPSLVAAID
jgi:putative SOS response-associated peptidase YedK